MTRKEVIRKLEEVAEASCNSLRKRFPESIFAWRWQGRKIVTSWDGADLNEIRLTENGFDVVNLEEERDVARAERN